MLGEFLEKISKKSDHIIVVNSNHDSHLTQYLERNLRNGYKNSFKDLQSTLEMQLVMIKRD